MSAVLILILNAALFLISMSGRFLIVAGMFYWAFRAAYWLHPWAGYAVAVYSLWCLVLHAVALILAALGASGGES